VTTPGASFNFFFMGPFASSVWSARFLPSLSGRTVDPAGIGRPGPSLNPQALRPAVIRRLPAVEMLGSMTVIGSDKAGTLTENRMTVMEIVTPLAGTTLHDGAETPPLSGSLRSLVLAGVLANEADLSPGEGGEEEVHGDPTEAAVAT
jgi:hypothetical protein